MIAIFNELDDAMDFAGDIHEFLTEHRGGYNADRWAYENKSDNDELWMVKIPEDDKRYDTYLQKPQNMAEVDSLPDNWKNTDDLI
jgi:hypothetical protein